MKNSGTPAPVFSRLWSESGSLFHPTMCVHQGDQDLQLRGHVHGRETAHSDRQSRGDSIPSPGSSVSSDDGRCMWHLELRRAYDLGQRF